MKDSIFSRMTREELRAQDRILTRSIESVEAEEVGADLLQSKADMLVLLRRQQKDLKTFLP